MEQKKGKLTLQINNLEALERLIGGDSEVEVDIRDNIVQAFMKKYLKGLITDDVIRKLDQTRNQIALEVKKEVVDEIKSNDGWWSKVTPILKPDVKELLDKFVDQKIEEKFKSMVLNEIEETKVKAKIALVLEEQATRLVNILSDRNLNTRLDAMVQEKLRNLLNK